MTIEEPTGLITWVLGALAAALSTCVSAIAWLYREEKTKNASDIKELKQLNEECQNDRLELSVRCASMEARLDQVEKTVKPEGRGR